MQIHEGCTGVVRENKPSLGKLEATFPFSLDWVKTCNLSEQFSTEIHYQLPNDLASGQGDQRRNCC